MNVVGSTSSRARDLREGGRWTPLQRVKNDVLFVLIVATLAIAERLPKKVLRVFGRFVGAAAWALFPGQKRIAKENIARAFPDLAEREQKKLARRVYRELGFQLGDVIATLDPRTSIEPLAFLGDSRECLEAAIAEGNGVVFASAHLGPWERVAASLVLAKIPLTVVAREPYDPRLERVYERLRGGRSVRAVYRGHAGAPVRLVRVLRRGGVLGVPMDLCSRVPSVLVPFLGTPAPTAIGPARLAVRTGAAVVVGTVARDETGALGLFFTRISGENELRDELALTRAINDELSQRIRAMPESWLWMHARWETTREG